MNTATGIRTLLETTRAAGPGPDAAPPPILLRETAPSRPGAVPAPRGPSPAGSRPAGSRPARPGGRGDARAPRTPRGPAVAAPFRLPVATGWPRPSRSGVPAVVLRRRRVAALVVVAVLAALFAAGIGVAIALARSPSEAAAGVAAGGAAPPAGSSLTVVGSGESLSDIARRSVPGADAAVTVERIRALNGLDGSAVRAGRPLVVPAG